MIINIEKTRSKFLKALDFIKGDRVLITSWIEPSPGKSPIFKRVKPIKGSKKERKENYNIEGIIDCIRFNYCYVIIEKKNQIRTSKLEIELKFSMIEFSSKINSNFSKTEFFFKFLVLEGLCWNNDSCLI